MILKFYNRVGVGNTSGWRYLDKIRDIEKFGPICEPLPPGQEGWPNGGAPRVFTNRGEIVEWAHGVWGESLDQYKPLIIPDFRIGPEGCGGDSDAYTIICVQVHFDDGSYGLVFLTQDEAYLMSDDGKTIDNLQ